MTTEAELKQSFIDAVESLPEGEWRWAAKNHIVSDLAVSLLSQNDETFYEFVCSVMLVNCPTCGVGVNVPCVGGEYNSVNRPGNQFHPARVKAR